MVFIELPLFIKSAKALLSAEEVRQLQNNLIKNPTIGDLIPHARGLRKLRIGLEGRGQRGGARVIYYFWGHRDQCYLIYAYAKNQQENLGMSDLQELAKTMERIINGQKSI